jgi:hypothetical protein
MQTNFIQRIGLLALKLSFFVLAAALAFVFVPDGFIDRVERGIDSAAGYLSGQAEQNMPVIKEEISRKGQETKQDAANLYQKFLEEQWPRIKGWFVGKFIW